MIELNAFETAPLGVMLPARLPMLPMNPFRVFIVGAHGSVCDCCCVFCVELEVPLMTVAFRARRAAARNAPSVFAPSRADPSIGHSCSLPRVHSLRCRSGAGAAR